MASQQVARLKDVRRTRNGSAVKALLIDLKKAAEDEVNLMPQILACVKGYATLGEIVEALKDIYGEYQEPITF